MALEVTTEEQKAAEAVAAAPEAPATPPVDGDAPAQPAAPEAAPVVVEDDPLIEETNLLTILARVETEGRDSAFAKLPEVAKIIELADAQMLANKAKVAAQPAAPAEEAATAADAPAEGDAAAPATPDEGAAPAESSAEVELKGTDLFTGKKQASEISTADEFAALMNSTLSIDLAKDGAYGTLANSIATFRTQAQQGSEAERRYKDLADTFKGLPLSMRTAITNYTNGQDWKGQMKSAMNGPDFDRDFGANTRDDVLKFYFPNDYQRIMDDFYNTEKEDYDQSKRDIDLSQLETLSRTQFDKDKISYTADRDAINTQADTFKQTITDSIGISEEALAVKYPMLGPKVKELAKQVLLNDTLGSLFYNKDGTFLPDAMEKVAYLLTGEDMVRTATVDATKKATLKTTEEMLALQSTKVQTSKKDAAQEPVSAELQEELAKRSASPIDQDRN